MYMDEWERFNEMLLSRKEELLKILQMQVTCMQKDFVKTLK